MIVNLFCWYKRTQVPGMKARKHGKDKQVEVTYVQLKYISLMTDWNLTIPNDFCWSLMKSYLIFYLICMVMEPRWVLSVNLEERVGLIFLCGGPYANVRVGGVWLEDKESKGVDQVFLNVQVRLQFNSTCKLVFQLKIRS